MTEHENAAETADPLVGQLFEGKYEILSVLGQGGMGTVYKARHVHMDKLLAIKTLVPGAVNDDNSFKRFEQEAKAAASLNHQNTIAVTDFGKSKQGFAFLVMEFLSGKTLEDVLVEEEEPVSLARFNRIFSQVCDGMQHAHKRGIIHRDLKPSNLMLIDSEDEVDLVKIVDFGLAKFSSTDTQNLTRTGVVMGSPPYMSPEQCRGDELDFRSDIYSLGCVMYATLTGQVPLKGGNSMATIYKHISDIPATISHVAPQRRIPSRLEQIVMQTLEKDPAKRPQSMSELGKSIKEAIANAEKSWVMPAFQTGMPGCTDSTRSVRGASNVAPGTNFPPDMVTVRPAPGPIPVPGSLAAPAAASESTAVYSASSKAAVPTPYTTGYGGAGTASTPYSRTGSAPAPAKAAQALPRGGKIVIAVLGLLVAAAGAWTMVRHPARNPVPADSADTSPHEQSSTTPAKDAAATSTASSTASSSTSSTGTEPTAVPITLPLKKKADSDATRKLEALKRAGDYKAKAALANNGKDYSSAEELYIKCLKEERVAWGAQDPHLLPTLAKVLETSRKANLPEDPVYIEDALQIFKKSQEKCKAIVNQFDTPASVWRPLGFACLEMSKMASGTTKQSYAKWAFDFYTLAYDSWVNRPKKEDYYRMLHSYLTAATESGDSAQAEQLRQEIMRSGQYMPAEQSSLPTQPNNQYSTDNSSQGYQPQFPRRHRFRWGQ